VAHLPEDFVEVFSLLLFAIGANAMGRTFVAFVPQVEVGQFSKAIEQGDWT